MIINATVGTGFKGALLYIHKSETGLKEEERPEVIEKNKVIGSNPNLIAYQMREQAEQSGRVQKPVLHLSFSFAEEDKITKEKEVEAIKSAMNHFGVYEEKHQYVIVKHNDSDHKHNHYHAIINKVDNENKTLNTDWLHNKCSGIADRVEQEHNLHRVKERQRIYDLEKDEYRYTTKEEKAKIVEKRQTKTFKEKAPKVNEYQAKIQSGVREVLADKSITTKETFISELAKRNIQAKVNIDENTNKIKGVSFRYDKKLSVKGGEIGYNANVVSQKLDENIFIKITQPELAKPNQIIQPKEEQKTVVPGAKSAPGPTAKLEPKAKAIRPIKDFDFTFKDKNGEYGFVKYSQDFKTIEIQTEQGKIITLKNDKNYSFSKRPNKEFHSIEIDILNKGKAFIEKGKTPYKIHKSNGSILFSTLTEDECINNKIKNTDVFISQDIKADYDDNSISDIDKKKKKVIPRRTP